MNRRTPRTAISSMTAAVFLGLLLTGAPARAEQPDAATIIKNAIDQWRGTSSHSTMSMTIKRKDWQRTMVMEGWTSGEKKSLVRVREPKKDAGNGTLLLDNKMWTFTPKINRVIKIPSSMMNQSWMGSDFSNKDISRSADIIDQYRHTLVTTEQKDGHKLYVIESVPKEDAPVVWGKEVVRVRDDYVMIEHAFYDQDMNLVKRMTTSKIGRMGGRVIAIHQRMGKTDTPNEYTEIEVLSARFDINIPDSTFTQASLRNPRN